MKEFSQVLKITKPHQTFLSQLKTSSTLPQLLILRVISALMLNESLPVQRDLEFEVKFNFISLISETKSHRVLIITQYLVTPPFSAILLKALSSSFRSETACLLTQSYLLSYRLELQVGILMKTHLNSSRPINPSPGQEEFSEQKVFCLN